MPQAATYIWDDKNQLEAGANEMKARADTIAKAWAYYYGDQTLPLKVSTVHGDQNVIMNLVGQAADDLVAMIGVPRFDVPGGSQREPDEAGHLRVMKSTEHLFQIVDKDGTILFGDGGQHDGCIVFVNVRELLPDLPRSPCFNR